MLLKKLNGAASNVSALSMFLASKKRVEETVFGFELVRWCSALVALGAETPLRWLVVGLRNPV
jgi:hypothetical protein